MANPEVNAIMAHFESDSIYTYRLENCPRDKANNLKKAVTRRLRKKNIYDKYCEVIYKKETQTAIFDIVS